jgi:hypothetical protein
LIRISIRFCVNVAPAALHADVGSPATALRTSHRIGHIFEGALRHMMNQ